MPLVFKLTGCGKRQPSLRKYDILPALQLMLLVTQLTRSKWVAILSSRSPRGPALGSGKGSVQRQGSHRLAIQTPTWHRALSALARSSSFWVRRASVSACCSLSLISNSIFSFSRVSRALSSSCWCWEHTFSWSYKGNTARTKWVRRGSRKTR